MDLERHQKDTGTQGKPVNRVGSMRNKSKVRMLHKITAERETTTKSDTIATKNTMTARETPKDTQLTTIKFVFSINNESKGD